MYRGSAVHCHRFARIFAIGVTSVEISLEGIQVAHRYRLKGAVIIKRLRNLAVATSALALLISAVVVLLVDPGESGASVIASSGQLQFESPPPEVSSATGQSNTLINFFTERTNYVLPAAVPIDLTPGSSFPTNYTGSCDLTPSTLSAGTDVDSYFMYSNPVGEPQNIYYYYATLTFSTPILGVMVTGPTMSATDAVVGAPGTTYESPEGLECDHDGDAVELVTPSTIRVEFATSISTDSIRVITAATATGPSPGGSGPGGTGPGGTGPGGTGPGGTSGGGFEGYTELASDGGIFNFGTQFFGSMGGRPLNAPMVGGVQVSGQPGYWAVASDGGVFSFGAAKFYGSTGGQRLNAPVVGMASTPDGLGYWLVASDGGIFNYGDAAFYGSRGGKRLNKPIIGMATTADGHGYWLVASDGGIFSYGDAHFYGSTGSLTLNKPIVGIAPTVDGAGYWLIASDGGIFSYGDAAFYGSMGGQKLNQPMVAIKTTEDGGGYWTVAADGGIFSFGDATFLGSMGGTVLNKPVVSAF